jgi:ADP-heptose:LPS heptosyltransferase
MTILLSRTDSIGDLILTLPMTGIIKEFLPEARIIMLTSQYAEPVAWYSRHVDTVWSWQQLLQEPDARRLALLTEAEIDWCIHVFPHRTIATQMREADIPHRVGTRSRLFHWLSCNHLPPVSRKHSSLHESQLNTQLLAPLLGKSWRSNALPLEHLAAYTGLVALQPLGDSFRARLHPAKFNLVLHPKSQGSAPEWSQESYKRLIDLLPRDQVHCVLTGTEREGEQMTELIDYALARGAESLVGETTVDELFALLAAADGIVASSTGPLHIAAALGNHALGLFTPRRPMHAGRWHPLGTHAETLTATIQCAGCAAHAQPKRSCACMDAITPEQVADRVRRWL